MLSPAAGAKCLRWSPSCYQKELLPSDAESKQQAHCWGRPAYWGVKIDFRIQGTTSSWLGGDTGGAEPRPLELTSLLECPHPGLSRPRFSSP